MRAAVEDVHHRHRQQVGVRPADVAEQRQVRPSRPRPGPRRARRRGSRWRRAWPCWAVPSRSSIAWSTSRCSEASKPDQRRADDVEDRVDRLADALAAVAVTAVAQLDRLERAGRGAGGHRGAADRAVVEGHLDLDGGVAARVEDLAGSYGFDRCHVSRSRAVWVVGRGLGRDGAAQPSPAAARTGPSSAGEQSAAAHGVAERLLGVDAGGRASRDQGQQPVADAGVDRAPDVRRRRAFASRASTLSASARAGSASGMPSSTERALLLRRLEPLPVAVDLVGVGDLEPGEDVRVPVDELVGDATGDVVDVEAAGAPRWRCGRGSTPAAAGRRAPRAGGRAVARCRSPRGSRRSPPAGTSPATGGSARGPTGTRRATGP